MYSLSMSQRNIYWNDLAGTGVPVNTLHTTLYFLEKIDVSMLNKAVNFVISNNDVFKLKLIHKDGEVFQDFRGMIKECAVDNTLYSEEELSVIFMQKKTWIFNMDKSLYDFTIYQKRDGLCVLSITTHHIIIDGFGIGILCDEIIHAYRSLFEGKTLLTEIQSFAKSLQSSENENKELKIFWDGYFEEYSIGTNPFLLKTNFIAASVYKEKIENSAILEFCAKHSITPYTVFTAALGIYLMNIYETNETLVIIPRMNREMHERKTMGCFVLPVPIKIKNNDSFSALCEQVMTEGKSASTHKKYDFSQIIEGFKKQFNTERLVSDFTLNVHIKDVKSSINTKLNFSACGAMRNLVTLNISNYESDNFYDITYDYRGDILNNKFMTFFHMSLENIIKQGINGTSVNEIKIVSDAELKYLKNQFKGETVSYSSDETIISLFKKTVKAMPNSPAVFTRDREMPLNYLELDDLSDKIANYLIKKGVLIGSLVGFLLERNFTLIPTILGILKAGCGFLPLDINHPKDRIEYIVKDSKALFIISTPELAGKLELDYLDINELLCGEKEVPLTLKINQNDLAYCIYTSGTTGQPKGVLIAHKGIVNITNPQNNPFNKAVCEIGTGIVAIGSICFDISLFEIFVFLLNGKFVAVVANDELANDEAISRWFEKTKANTLHCTPSRLQSYLSGSLFANALKTHIKLILSAGEVLHARVATLINDYNIKIYNGYGPTEITIGATITEAGDCDTIGKPIANMSVHIVDSKRNIRSFGVIGEIAVTGDGVGIGYLGNKKLTKDKFIVINNERAYLTGDLGYFIPDGRLKYVARNDNQIKLRGHRIELAEIEQCTQKYKGVDNCVVIVKVINGIEHLVLYYSGKESNIEKIKEHLGSLLSFYMIPQIIVKMPTLPINNNGKTDRLALETLPVLIERVYVAPSTKEEEVFCEAFKTVLSLSLVGIDDNFFEIGGNSLSAIKMLIYINAYGIDMEYSFIFKYPTPRLLAKNIGKNKIQNYLSPLVSANKKEFVKIDRLLHNNPDENLYKTPLGNVFITGTTGFLGSHIVKHLLEDTSVNKIFCLVRAKGKLNPESRLKTTLFYYFTDISEEKFKEKIEVIDGDMTNKSLFANITDKIDTVINCAANVAHFAYGDALKSVNIDAVENLIDFCKIKNATFIHVSTTSVAGHSLKKNIIDTAYTENDLYKGQIISNEYIYSKFVAEYLILKAKINGLKAKIMRVGNLQGRMDDGEFQINLQENAFARNIKAFAAIGYAPATLKEEVVNITPVDETAVAVLLLARLSDNFTVFHVINPISSTYDEIFYGLLDIDIKVQYMDNEEFEALVDKLSKDSVQSKFVEGLLIRKSYALLNNIPVNAVFTVKVLDSLGFEFKPIEKDYVKKYLYMLNGLGFFDGAYVR